MISNTRKNHFHEWLLESRIDKKLDAVYQEASPHEEKYITSPQFEAEVRARARNLIKDFDFNVSEGTIRTFPFAVDKNMGYLAVLKRWEDDMWLVAPYSRFATPATDTELKTTRDSQYLKVLQLWNARTVPYCYLAQGWQADEMTQEEQKDVWACFNYSMSGKKLKKVLSDRTGVPIIRKDDPRIEYLDEEMAAFVKLDRLIEIYEYWHNKNTFFEATGWRLIESSIKQEMPLAAAGHKAETTLCYFLEDKLNDGLRKLNEDSVKIPLKVYSFQPINAGRKIPEIIWDLPPDAPGKPGDLLYVFSRESKNVVGTGILIGPYAPKENCKRRLVMKFGTGKISEEIDSPEKLFLITGRYEI